MKKYILPLALLTLAATGYAQENLYLVKGDKVVAKYPVTAVDYATFSLPEGVIDPGDEGNVVESKTYLSASPVYFGTDSDCGRFQIMFSTKGISEENPPLDLLYIQMTTPRITDISDIQIAEGTYTLSADGALAPFRFYAGARSGEGTEPDYGSVVVLRPDNFTTEYLTVNDGYFNVRKEGSQYMFSGMLKLENGNIVNFSYDGPMVVINESDEKPPVEDLPLPASALTENYNVTPLASEAYVTIYKSLFADAPKLEYVMFNLYEDSNYSNCLDAAVLVDREKYADVLLPKGTYTMYNRVSDNVADLETAACPAFLVMGDGVIGTYGSWLTLNYVDKAPLVKGTIEVLEDVTSWNDVKIKVNLFDNAETPHEVTCEFSGSVFPL